MSDDSRTFSFTAGKGLTQTEWPDRRAMSWSDLVPLLTQHKRGMKLLRVWVPDPARPEFVEEAKRQAYALRGRHEEIEALTFIEAAFEWPEA